MPELPEVEAYRRLAARAEGWEITSVQAEDTWFLKRGTTAEALRHAAVGAKIERARRVGKLMLLDLDSGDTLGLHFGMSGTLVLSGDEGIETVTYSGHRVIPEWDRFVLQFGEKRRMSINDARRLGGVELNPDELRLGPDALALDLDGLRTVIGQSRAPLKARLLNQQHIAGVGNLIADETLWRADLDPARPANSLDDRELKRLQKYLSNTVNDFIANGGSGTGILMTERNRDGRCPKDGTPLERRKVGGRTTYSCPKHQK